MDKIIKLRDLEDSQYDMYFLVNANHYEKAIELVKLAQKIVDEDEHYISMYEEIVGLWSDANIQYVELNLDRPDYEIEY